MSGVHSDYVGGTFRCTICAKEFFSKDAADKHFHETHTETTIVGE